VEAPVKLRRTSDGREFDVELLAREGAAVRATLGGREVAAQVEPLPGGDALVTIAGRRWRIAAARRNSSIFVAAGPRSFEFVPVEETARRHARGLAAPEVTAPMPGKVLKVLVAEGERVEPGQPLVVIEAMKMETTLAAESAAVVRRVRAAEGQMVDHGAVLIELSPLPGSSPPESGPPAQ
jgi:3-methylcrotonyl-CoA carboxylase alpha subunit